MLERNCIPFRALSDKIICLHFDFYFLSVFRRGGRVRISFRDCCFEVIFPLATKPEIMTNLKRIVFQYLFIPSRSLLFQEKQHRLQRDLLHVSGLLLTGDTLDAIVCHLPSRSGGAKESEPYRLHAARILRTEADSPF